MSSSSRSEQGSPSPAPQGNASHGIDRLWNILAGTTGLSLAAVGLLVVLGWPVLVSYWKQDTLVPFLESPSILLAAGLLLLSLLGLALRLLAGLLNTTAPAEETHVCFAEYRLPAEFLEQDWQTRFLSHSKGSWKQKSNGLLLEQGRWGAWGRLFVLGSLFLLGVVVGLDLFLSTGWLWNRTARLLAPWMLFGLVAQVWTPHTEIWLLCSDKGLLLYGRTLDGSYGTLQQRIEQFVQEWEPFAGDELISEQELLEELEGMIAEADADDPEAVEELREKTEKLASKVAGGEA